MKVEQLSIFLENKVGRLAEVTTILAQAGINIKALSLADTSEFGILRLIVDKSEEAQAALKAKNITVGRTGVVAVEVPHTPGGLNQILHILEKRGVNVEYMYGLTSGDENASIVLKASDQDKALKAIEASDFELFSSDETYYMND